MARTLVAVALVTLAACGSSSNNAMTGACAAVVNGCSTFENHTTDNPAIITFTSFAYTPRCIEVKVGQNISIQGAFAVHPLSETCGPVDAIPHKTSETTSDFQIATAGTYGYQCDAHHATNDMVGAIKVDP